MIHCIGDSHASVYSGQVEMQPIYPESHNCIIPNIKSYRIGPATAYQLHTKMYIINHIIANYVKENDFIMFLFGEVDCRVHLPKHKNVNECVTRYFNVINNYKNIIVCGPIASSPDNRACEIPHIGTCIERNEITKEFNSLLKEICDNHNIPFITVLDEMLLDDGNTNPDYLADQLHASIKIIPLVQEKLKGVLNAD